MLINIVSIILGALSLIGFVSYVIAFFISPVALYKGFKNKNWKLGKILIAMFICGLVLQFASMTIYMIIKSF